MLFDYWNEARMRVAMAKIPNKAAVPICAIFIWPPTQNATTFEELLK